jgi:predicted dehydrogenase
MERGVNKELRGGGRSGARALSRREFVRRSGVGVVAGSAALAGLPAILEAGTLRGDEQVRLAWIGAGGRGSSHIRDAMDHLSTANFTVRAICDIDPAARERGIHLCGPMRPEGIDDYRRVLDLGDVDAVFIATPVYLHAEMAVAAAAAGKHIYLEKPLGRTPAEVAAITRAVSASRIRFQVGFQWRYDVRWEEGIRRIHAGEIGKVHFISAHRHVAGYPTSGWYVDRDLSGDLIVEQAVHEMNVFCWLMKGPPLRASGFGGINALLGVPQGRTVMDHYTVSYEFPGDVRLSYSHCVYAPPSASGLEQLVLGKDAAMDLRDATLHRGGETIKATFESLPNATGRAIASFIDCVRNDREPLSNLEAGRNATLMAILGRTAIHERRVAEWTEVAG